MFLLDLLIIGKILIGQRFQQIRSYRFPKMISEVVDHKSGLI